MASKPSLHSSPPAQRLSAILSWLGILLLLLLAGQGCGESQASKTAKSSGALENGKRAGREQNYDLAIADFSEAIRLNPKNAMAYYSRAFAYRDKGDFDRAIADDSEAIRLKPEDATAYITRGFCYTRKGDYDKAIADYIDAIRLKPEYSMDYYHLAKILATCPDPNVRNGAKAVEYATKACELEKWNVQLYLDTLASAYAESGDFDNAVKWENKYLESNPPKDDYITPEKARQRLSLYEQKKPYHEEKP